MASRASEWPTYFNVLLATQPWPLPAILPWRSCACFVELRAPREMVVGISVERIHWVPSVSSLVLVAP